MTERDSFADYRARLDALGFHPSSTLGQNFLLDASLHRWLCEQANPTADDLVVEIGVGLGFLTRELASRAGQVLGIEIDARVLTIAREDLASHRNVELVHADALSGPQHTLCEAIVAASNQSRARGEFLVVANLPYAVSGPLIAELACLPTPPLRAVLLVQKELASRIAAGVDMPDYGGLSVLAQSVFATRVLRDVPAQVFRPRPKVTSSVLLLQRRPLASAWQSSALRRQFAGFVRRLFQQRRKVLRHNLPAAYSQCGMQVPSNLPSEVLALRAEVLAPVAVQELFLLGAKPSS